VRANLRTAKSQLRHGAAQFIRCLLRILHRQRRQAHEPLGMALHHRRMLLVLKRRAGGCERRLLIVEEGVHRGADELHVDAVPVHIGEPEIVVPDFLGHRLLHNLPGDLHVDGAVGLRDQLWRDARRLLAQKPDRLLRQHMSVDVDRRGHWRIIGRIIAL
jgi:hypothetical protein